MITLAVQRALPEAKAVRADMATIRWTDTRRNIRYAYLTPRSAARELVKFDQGIKPEPFAFELRGAIHLSRSVAAAKRKKPGSAVKSVAKPSSLPREARRNGRTEPEIRAAINDPKAHLGSPKLILDRAGPNRGNPVKVGGKAPTIGQLQPVRRFGACEFIE